MMLVVKPEDDGWLYASTYNGWMTVVLRFYIWNKNNV